MKFQPKRLLGACAAIAFLQLGVAHAGGSTGVITQLLSMEPGILMFTAGSHVSKPACSTVGDDWALDARTAAGKLMVSTIMTAYALGKAIHVEGGNDCGAWGDRERPQYLYIIN